MRCNHTLNELCYIFGKGKGLLSFSWHPQSYMCTYMAVVELSEAFESTKHPSFLHSAKDARFSVGQLKRLSSSYRYSECKQKNTGQRWNSERMPSINSGRSEQRRQAETLFDRLLKRLERAQRC